MSFKRTKTVIGSVLRSLGELQLHANLSQFASFKKLVFSQEDGKGIRISTNDCANRHGALEITFINRENNKQICVFYLDPTDGDKCQRLPPLKIRKNSLIPHELAYFLTMIISDNLYMVETYDTNEELLEATEFSMKCDKRASD